MLKTGGATFASFDTYKRNHIIGFSIYVLVGENLRPIQSVISFFPTLGWLRV